MTTRRQIDINHGELRAMLEQLGGLEGVEAIHEALASLLLFLRKHFAAEESPDSFFDMIRAGAPKERETVTDLVQQHEQFVATIEQLVAHAEAGGSAELQADISQLIRGLEAHELIEHRLLRLHLHSASQAQC
jgi:hemerythrin